MWMFIITHLLVADGVEVNKTNRSNDATENPLNEQYWSNIYNSFISEILINNTILI